MPTNIYYTDTLSSLTVASRVIRKCSLSRGSGVITKTQNTDGFGMRVYDTGTTWLWFAMQVNAYSATTGTYTFNHWGFESNAMANYSAGLSGFGDFIQVYDSTGTYRFDLYSAIVSSVTEYGTAAAVRTATSAAGTARTINDGDYLVFCPIHIEIGTPATGYTLNFSYNGTTAASNGDSYVTVPDTITEYAAPGGGSFPYIGGGYYP